MSVCAGQSHPADVLDGRPGAARMEPTPSYARLQRASSTKDGPSRAACPRPAQPGRRRPARAPRPRPHRPGRRGRCRALRPGGRRPGRRRRLRRHRAGHPDRAGRQQRHVTGPDVHAVGRHRHDAPERQRQLDDRDPARLRVPADRPHGRRLEHPVLRRVHRHPAHARGARRERREHLDLGHRLLGSHGRLQHGHRQHGRLGRRPQLRVHVVARLLLAAGGLHARDRAQPAGALPAQPGPRARDGRDHRRAAHHPDGRRRADASRPRDHRARHDGRHGLRGDRHDAAVPGPLRERRRGGRRHGPERRRRRRDRHRARQRPAEPDRQRLVVRRPRRPDHG